MKTFKEYCLCLFDKDMMPTALKVSVVVGSILFIINHGSALVKERMDRERWISAALTYVVPYLVNIHGQYISRSKQG
ncbi:nitrate/nitrite transporter NrtS [Chlorogloeopsis sp. ULAP01]|uniref:nitrate/nitrite transporter NrtS n=1 Tax=Chlorogloeopsis sp. ULAP01 TaxID=3056483 RepID=UPI0025AA3F83|nr:nitrate/nitrite transporter NrtS [Chlorogloeopsis sp. ULAP01]MDM9382917.1 nitrate/nitrite transporter NrtS [Chlorogloeopsis sp. ULAP01]